MAANGDPMLDADAIAGREFPTSFRGYDPNEVRRYLQQLADTARRMPEPSPRDDRAMADLTKERDELRRRVGQLERSLATAENDDAIHVTSLITSETTQVIESARAAAAKILQKAETEASRRRKEVKELEQRVDAEIQEKRSAAAEDTARVRRETMTEVTKLRNEADEETRAQRAKADEYATTTRAQAQEILRSRTAEAETFYETRMRKTEEATAAMRAEAEEEATTMRRNAEEASATMRREAEEETTALRRRTDEEVKAMRAKAEAEAEDLRTAAQARVDELNVEADKVKAESENAANIARAEASAAADLATREVRDEARMMVAEARAVREKILTDLVRRRRTARQQIDQARAARDRLMRSLEDIRRELDLATGELSSAVDEARSAMDRVPVQQGDDDAEVAAALTTLDRARPERGRSFNDLGETPETEAYAARISGSGDADRSGSDERSPTIAAAVDGDLDDREPSGVGDVIEPADADSTTGDDGVGPSGGDDDEATVVEAEQDEREFSTDALDAETPDDSPPPPSGPVLTSVDERPPPDEVDEFENASAGGTDGADDSDASPWDESRRITRFADTSPDRDDDGYPRTTTVERELGDSDRDEERTADVDTEEVTEVADHDDVPEESSEPPIETDAERERIGLFDAAIGNVAEPPPTRSAGLFGLGAASTAVGERTSIFDRAVAPGDVQTEDESAPSEAATGDDVDLDAEHEGVGATDLAERKETIDALGPDLKRQLKRALADDQSELLDAIRRGGKDASIADLPAPERQVARFADALEGALRTSASRGAATVDGRIWPSLVDPLVASTAHRLVDDVREVVNEAVTRDRGNDAALETIRGHYREIRTNRLGRLVDSVLGASFDMGVQKGRE